MWTLIRETDLEEFLRQYPDLQQFPGLVLHTANGFAFLPRHIYNNYPHYKLIRHVDKTWTPQPLELQFIGSLRDEQPQIVAPFLHRFALGESMSGGLKARPGAGKTVMGIYLACQTNLKTLICIDNTKLAEQWMESILTFTTATMDDIGWVKGDDFVVDRPFVIAMVQTLVSKVKRDINKYYEILREAGFGLALLDEYHQSASGPRYATASLLMNSKDIIGLSATPYGIGQAHFLMRNVVGDILSDTKTYQLKPKVHFVLYNSGLTEKYGKSVLRIQDMIRRRAKYNKIIIESEAYLAVVNKIVTTSLEKNHRIITIAFTTDQVESISHYLTQKNIPNRQFYSKKRTVDKENDNVLIATYKFAGAGFDFKQLSCCIIATPLSGRKSLIQVIGRILREYEGKTDPEVFILIDRGFNGIFEQSIRQIENIINAEFNCETDMITL